MSSPMDFQVKELLVSIRNYSSVFHCDFYSGELFRAADGAGERRSSSANECIIRTARSGLR
jgi:hypothetical protein